MDPAIEERLKKGAVALGEYWRAGDRCATGWGVNPLAIVDGEDSEKAIERWACSCEKKSRFCKAKALWFRLALMELREECAGEFGIALMMASYEWDLTGLTLKYPINQPAPGGKVIGIGQKGLLTMGSLLNLMKVPETFVSTVQLMQAFPGAKIDSIQEPAPKPVAELAAVADGGGEEPFE